MIYIVYLDFFFRIVTIVSEFIVIVERFED